jgi:hypothetical protein
VGWWWCKGLLGPTSWVDRLAGWRAAATAIQCPVFLFTETTDCSRLRLLFGRVCSCPEAGMHGVCSVCSVCDSLCIVCILVHAMIAILIQCWFA